MGLSFFFWTKLCKIMEIQNTGWAGQRVAGISQWGGRRAECVWGGP